MSNKKNPLGGRAEHLTPPPPTSLFQSTEPRPAKGKEERAEQPPATTQDTGVFRKTCAFPNDLYEQLRTYAFKKRCNANSVIVTALREYLERNQAD